MNSSAEYFDADIQPEKLSYQVNMTSIGFEDSFLIIADNQPISSINQRQDGTLQLVLPRMVLCRKADSAAHKRHISVINSSYNLESVAA